MANRLKMAMRETIQQLHSLRWSQRRIARELGIDRGTVRKHLQAVGNGPKPAIPPAGSGGSKPATLPGVPGSGGCGPADDDCAGVDGSPKPAIPPSGFEASVEGSKPAIPPAGSAALQAPPRASAPRGRNSACEPYREIVEAKLRQELSAQRIYQDLVREHGFRHSYDSVKRFVRRLSFVRPLPLRRMECAAGEEAQVDFGSGAMVITPDGRRRRTHVFRVVLSHSRKAYSQAVYRQTTEDFLRCLEDAFWHFGGVPRTLVIDNLRSAVRRADWFDPELVPRLQSFCRHYGTVILPTKPRTPRHKGKIERGIGYVKGNALKARTFTSLAEQNRFLLDWEQTIADTRIHGTTRRQVQQVFVDVERAALRPLPAERFPSFQEAQRKVNRDGHIEVARAYYSAPPEYLGRTVWARWDARLVRIFNQRFEQIAVHVRHEQGRFSTNPQHIVREKISGLERGAAWLLRKVALIGPHAQRWAEAMLTARGIEGTRVLMGLISLTRRHAAESLENACATALSYGAFRLRTIRSLVQRQAARQQPLPFLEEHPLIRPLDDYARVVADALERTERTEARRPQGVRSAGFPRHGWADECRPGKQESPGGSDRQGLRDIHPPRSGYPSSGCSAAEPDSVSPDDSSVRPCSTTLQENCHE